MDLWSWIWAIWAAFVLGSFGLLEGIALSDKIFHNTLTAKTRLLCGIDPPNWRRRIGVPVFTGVLLGFVTWFLPHIVLGWWGGSGSS